VPKRHCCSALGLRMMYAKLSTLSRMTKTVLVIPNLPIGRCAGTTFVYALDVSALRRIGLSIYRAPGRVVDWFSDPSTPFLKSVIGLPRPFGKAKPGDDDDAEHIPPNAPRQ
jgi:hypothetical protein